MAPFSPPLPHCSNVQHTLIQKFLCICYAVYSSTFITLIYGMSFVMPFFFLIYLFIFLITRCDMFVRRNNERIPSKYHITTISHLECNRSIFGGAFYKLHLIALHKDYFMKCLIYQYVSQSPPPR